MGKSHTYIYVRRILLCHYGHGNIDCDPATNKHSRFKKNTTVFLSMHIEILVTKGWRIILFPPKTLLGHSGNPPGDNGPNNHSVSIASICGFMIGDELLSLNVSHSNTKRKSKPEVYQHCELPPLNKVTGLFKFTYLALILEGNMPFPGRCYLIYDCIECCQCSEEDSTHTLTKPFLSKWITYKNTDDDSDRQIEKFTHLVDVQISYLHRNSAAL